MPPWKTRYELVVVAPFIAEPCSAPLAVAMLTLSLAACTLGPDYQRPDLPVASEFKQAEGWKPATPADALQRGEWWRLYGDAELDALVARLNVSNQNLAAAEAQFRQARALVRGARARSCFRSSPATQASRARRGVAAARIPPAEVLPVVSAKPTKRA